MADDLFARNKALQQHEYEAGNLVLSSYPTIVNLPVASRCNLKCFMCSISVFPDAYKISIAPEAYKKIEMLYPYLETLELEGAEVFTAKDGAGEIVDDIINASEEYPGLKLAALTNGQLIDERRAEKIVSKFGVLNVSLDTPDAATYESIRIGGKFDILINNIKRVNALKKERGLTPLDAPRLQFSAIVMKRTYKDLVRLVDLISELGGVYFSFQPLRQEIPDENFSAFLDEDIFKDKEALAEFLKIAEIAKSRASELGINVLDRTKTYAMKFHPSLIEKQKQDASMPSACAIQDAAVAKSDATETRPVCRFPWRNLFVRPNGDVAFSCCSKKVIGNINRQQITEIWNGPEAVEERARFLKGDYRNCNINCQMGYSFAGTELDTKLNICLISQEYPPDTNWGGIATYTQVLARQLAKLGHKVDVVTLAEGDEYTTDDMGVVVHRVARAPKEKWDSNCLRNLDHDILRLSHRIYEKVREIHDKDTIDVIEAPETCAQALLTFLRLEGVVKITRLHTPFFWVRQLNDMPDTPQHLVRDQLEKLQTQLSTAVTSPTYAMAEVVRNRWQIGEIEVVPNFFTPKTYTPDLSVFKSQLEGKDYLLFFGRLEYRKGVHVLAQALPAVLEKENGLTAVFIGSDSIYNSQSMKAFMIEQLKDFEDRLVFIENIPHATLYPIIERARVVVLPSLWENFPYVCLEAMSLGKAVVACNAGGFPEIIEDGVEGVLCSPGDPTSLQNAILQALSKPDLKAMGEKARLKAGTFDMEIVGDMLRYYKAVENKIQKGAGKAKIAYILRHIPVPSETFVINEIIAMQSTGFEIHPISLLPAQICHESLMAQVEQEVFNLADPDLDEKAKLSPNYETASLLAQKYKIAPSLGAQAALVADYITNKKISHLHAHFATESAWVALVASNLTGVPFSFTAHAYDIFMRDRNIIKEESLEERLDILVGQCARAFTISDYNKSYIVSKTDPSYTDKIKVVRCGIDPGRFQLAARQSRPEVTFLSVGRFVEKKGFQYLLQAFKAVSELMDNVQLRIIGEGQHRQQMMEMAASLEIADKVAFLGPVSSDLVLEEMNNADVFTLHSVTAGNGDKEGIPVSIMEASATGLPVVSTNHSGISELVLNGITGLLSEERDVESFANGMIALAMSPQLRQRMGAAGRDHVLRNFNQQMEAEKLADEFKCLNQAKQSSLSHESVDIIMPTYTPNPAYLRRAIDSILNQTFSNWHLYLVQDGNDCDIQSILKEVNDDRIHYFELPHRGKPAALNFALGQGSSKYVAYLDDDDIWYPNHLMESVSYMARTGAKFVHTDSHEIFISTEGDRFEEVSRRSLNKGVITNKTLWYISHINAVHERSLLELAGAYDESLPFFIDWDMFQRLAKYARPHHLNVYTCEHYMYLNKENKESNTISSAHKKDPDFSRRMSLKMFEKSFALLTPADFAEFARDWQYKAHLLEEKEKELAALKEILFIEKEDLRTREEKVTAQYIERLNDLAATSQQLQANLQEKDRIIQDKEARNNELLNSLSWKVSAPLRWGFDRIMKFKK